MSKSTPPRKSSAASAAQPLSPRTTPLNRPAPPIVSGRWLLGGLAIALLAAVLCAWGTLCILFWQGSWQLLYHPTSAVTNTPANATLSFESIGFASNASGEPQLRGWWIPAASQPRFTAIYLHSQTGNLSDTIGGLEQLHAAGLNVFAFDYRGYGQSHFEHPSEQRWREDAESALHYLTGTRHISSSSILLIGRDLGANLALEVAARHSDLAGIVLDQPLASPTAAIFGDARSHLVPAHLLVSDRWDADAAASNLLIPSLWFYNEPKSLAAPRTNPNAYQAAPARRFIVWLSNSPDQTRQFSSALSAFLDQLQKPAK
ncbi:alpha/beta hydrolase [Occallatibacter savannae]|uniref:alpha/beta hydrolase n=1 Tax=Occallatibacter savannae TaxID=1002691 RepID=UPI0013A58D68|nr:alpha/beta fold hydrolase [Occallatibacter savannae]